MIQAQFIQARELIRQKRFDEARAILREIDHPTAKEWLAKLDQIAPVQPQSAPVQGQSAPVQAQSAPVQAQPRDLKAQLVAARELLVAKQYAEARAILSGIDHPTAKEWLARLDQIAPVQAQSAPVEIQPTPTAQEHDGIVIEAQHLLLRGDFDRARELLEPLNTPAAAFWIDKTAINQFRSHENLWLDMFRYALASDPPVDPATWSCPVCGRRVAQTPMCPQRGQPPCPMEIEELPIEEPRRLALILEALQHDQAQDIEKLAGPTDVERLEHWRRALQWQFTRLHEPDIRLPAIAAAIPLLGELIEKRREQR